jgi:2-methylcitrate dehydratase
MFDPRLRALIAKVEVVYDKELDKMQPQSVPCRLEVRLKNGERRVSSVDHPLGHIRNPASDEDIERKFKGLNNGLVSSRRVSRLLRLCWKLDELEDISEVVSLMLIRP